MFNNFFLTWFVTDSFPDSNLNDFPFIIVFSNLLEIELNMELSLVFINEIFWFGYLQKVTLKQQQQQKIFQIILPSLVPSFFLC